MAMIKLNKHANNATVPQHRGSAEHSMSFTHGEEIARVRHEVGGERRKDKGKVRSRENEGKRCRVEGGLTGRLSCALANG